MAKLILKSSCYASTDAAVKKIIEKGRIRYAAAYCKSKTYLCD